MSEIILIGQKHVLFEISKKIEENRLAHSYLVSGPSGSGKLPLSIKFAEMIMENGKKIIGSKVTSINPISHPDIHFVFPVNTNSRIKTKAISNNFITEWREMVGSNPYFDLSAWLEKIEAGNKKGNISVNEAEDIAKKMAMKSYEGGHKVMIVWMAEKMNTECSNKLLKIIEEPGPKTTFIFITENKTKLLATIRSRCQEIITSPLKDEQIQRGLKNYFNIEENKAVQLTNQCNSNFIDAIKLLNNSESLENFEKMFIDWVRLAFKVKSNKSVVKNLVDWAEKISKLNKDLQKQFLTYALENFRAAILKNYKSSTYDRAFIDPGFNFDSFTPFVHDNNIIELFKEINTAIYELERNGNSKIILTDLSLKLTRLIHKKPNKIDA
jgi:DNA polymerase-3 subunit delta'